MKDYCSMFVDLCLKQCTEDDYDDRSKVKIHNAAYKQLWKLQNEMKQIDCTEMLTTLLEHEDERVKIGAATMCFKEQILVETAKSVLMEILQNTKDKTFAFNAKLLLEQAPQCAFNAKKTERK